MKLRTRILVAVAVLAGLIGVGAVSAPYVYAATAITVTAPASVQVGQPITFAATASDGSVPSGQKITWTNPISHKLNNVANYTVIPVTFDPVSGAYLFTYVPNPGEVGRTETFSVVTSCTRLGCLVTGYASFTVTP